MKKATIVLCILWIVVIFHMSGEDGIISNNKSYRIVNLIKQYYVKNNKNVIQENKTDSSKQVNKGNGITQVSKVDDTLNFYVRKGAHFIMYMILALLVGFTLSSVNFKGKNAIIYILFICLFCGVMDEYVQSFTSRTSSVRDIFIDFSGSAFGTAMFYLFTIVSDGIKLNKSSSKYKANLKEI